MKVLFPFDIKMQWDTIRKNKSTCWKISIMFIVFSFAQYFQETTAHPKHIQGSEIPTQDKNSKELFNGSEGLKDRKRAMWRKVQKKWNELGEKSTEQDVKQVVCEAMSVLAIQAVEKVINKMKKSDEIPLTTDEIGTFHLSDGYMTGLSFLSEILPITSNCTEHGIMLQTTLSMIHVMTAYKWMVPPMKYEGIAFASAENVQLDITVLVVNYETGLATVRIVEMKIKDMVNFRHSNVRPSVFEILDKDHRNRLYKSIYASAVEDTFSKIFSDKLQRQIYESFYKFRLRSPEIEFKGHSRFDFDAIVRKPRHRISRRSVGAGSAAHRGHHAHNHPNPPHISHPHDAPFPHQDNFPPPHFAPQAQPDPPSHQDPHSHHHGNQDVFSQDFIKDLSDSVFDEEECEEEEENPFHDIARRSIKSSGSHSPRGQYPPRDQYPSLDQYQPPEQYEQRDQYPPYDNRVISTSEFIVENVHQDPYSQPVRHLQQYQYPHVGHGDDSHSDVDDECEDGQQPLDGLHLHDVFPDLGFAVQETNPFNEKKSKNKNDLIPGMPSMPEFPFFPDFGTDNTGIFSDNSGILYRAEPAAVGAPRKVVSPDYQPNPVQ